MTPKRQNELDEYTEDEVASRRDAVVRRMTNTPPQPRTTPVRPPKKKTKAVAGRAVRKTRANREA